MSTSSSNAGRSTDEQAIRQLIADAEKHQSDVEPFLSLHTEDVVLVNIAGILVLGKQALRSAMTKALESRLANVITRTEVMDIRLVTFDVAIVSCVKHVSDENADATGELPSRGSLTYTLVKTPDGWRIALAQTTPMVG